MDGKRATAPWRASYRDFTLLPFDNSLNEAQSQPATVYLSGGDFLPAEEWLEDMREIVRSYAQTLIFDSSRGRSWK